MLQYEFMTHNKQNHCKNWVWLKLIILFVKSWFYRAGCNMSRTKNVLCKYCCFLKDLNVVHLLLNEVVLSMNNNLIQGSLCI